MSTRRVYVVWTQPLFHESVRLILKHPDIQFVGENTDCVAAQNEILDLRPDTILIEELVEGQHNEVMKVLEACTWNARVVLISLNDNQLNLYHHEERTVGGADDLLQLVLW